MAKSQKKSTSARPRDPLRVAVANQQERHPVARDRLRAAVRTVLRGEGVGRCTISLAVVDDPTIHRLNREYLQHDYPTDVLSFLLEEGGDDRALEGEIIVSADTAARSAPEYGWSAEAELTLYVIHGTLHLVGYDDHSAADQKTMRGLERRYLEQLGIAVP